MPYRFRINPARLITLTPAGRNTVLGATHRLAAVREDMSRYEDTDVGAASVAAAKALERCAEFARTIESGARLEFDSWRGEDGRMDRALAEVESRLPANVGVTAGDRQLALRAAEAKVLEQHAEEAFARAIAAKQAQVDALGNAAVGAMRLLRERIAAAEAKQAGPLALRVQLSMQDIQTIAALRESEAKTSKPSDLRKTLDGLIAAGDEKSEELFCAAIELDMKALVSMTEGTLRARLGVTRESAEGRDVLARERAAAIDLVRRISDRREARIPESLAMARLAEEELKGAFRALIGEHASVMTPAEYERFKNSSREPLKISGSWPRRVALALWDGR